MEQFLIHKPRTKSSGRIHLSTNELTSRMVSGDVLITTELWNEVKQPWIIRGVLSADRGYRWVKRWEVGLNNCVRKVLDPADRLVHAYVDICAPVVAVKDGYEYIDWYLDVFQDIVNKKEPELLDEEEFAIAIECGYVTASDAKMAWDTAQQVKRRLSLGELLDF